MNYLIEFNPFLCYFIKKWKQNVYTKTFLLTNSNELYIDNMFYSPENVKESINV